MVEIIAADLLETNFLRVDENEPISKFIGRIASAGKDTALVFDGKNFLGIVSKRQIARRSVNVSKAKVSNVLESAPILSLNDSIFSIAESMYSSGARILPVEENGKVSGIVSSVSVIRQIKNFPELRNLKAKDIASFDMVVLDEKESIGKALSVMKQKNVKKIPVTDSKKKLVGIVRFEDIMLSYLKWASDRSDVFRSEGGASHTNEKESILETPISNLISSSVSMVEENTAISDLIDGITREDSCVVVGKNGFPAGIITHKDLLSGFLKLQKSLSEKRNIQFVSLPELDEIDSAQLEKMLEELYDKSRKLIGKEVLLVVHFKEQKKSQLRAKHFVHIRLSSPGLRLVADCADWKFLPTVQKTISKISAEINKLESKKKR